MDSYRNLKVRFAPSLTGEFHLGNLLPSWCDYLASRKYNGEFLLRIDDTDTKRDREEYLLSILSNLRYFSLHDGKDYFRQSDRLVIYHSRVESLLREGLAYRCSCRNEERNRIFRCNHQCDQRVGTSIRLDVVRTSKLIEDANLFFYDSGRKHKFNFKPEEIEDFILLKSNGFPTYHLATVVDDIEKEITLVIRGEEWLKSTPKHILLYRAFNGDLPLFIHLPILKDKNNKKLSKRLGGYSISRFLKEGILKESLLNYLYLLLIKTDKEILSIEEMINNFSLEGLHFGTPCFDLEKLLWINLQHLSHSLSEEEIFQRLVDGEFIGDKARNNREKVLLILKSIRRSFSTLFELGRNINLLFTSEVEISHKIEENKDLYEQIKNLLPRLFSSGKVTPKEIDLMIKKERKTPEEHQFLRISSIGEIHGLATRVITDSFENLARRIERILNLLQL